MSSPEQPTSALDPTKLYGRLDRTNPDVVLGTDSMWDAAMYRLQKAATAAQEGRLFEANRHREMAETHLSVLLRHYERDSYDDLSNL